MSEKRVYTFGVEILIEVVATSQKEADGMAWKEAYQMTTPDADINDVKLKWSESYKGKS